MGVWLRLAMSAKLAVEVRADEPSAYRPVHRTPSPHMPARLFPLHPKTANLDPHLMPSHREGVALFHAWSVPTAHPSGADLRTSPASSIRIPRSTNWCVRREHEGAMARQGEAAMDQRPGRGPISAMVGIGLLLSVVSGLLGGISTPLAAEEPKH